MSKHTTVTNVKIGNTMGDIPLVTIISLKYLECVKSLTNISTSDNPDTTG